MKIRNISFSKVVISVAVTTVLLSGCAQKSGAMKIGKDTYMISNQAASGFSGIGNLKAEAFEDANSFCESRGQEVQFVNSTEAKPPFIFGNFPKVEIQFMCVHPTDKDYKHLQLQKDSDTLIENHK